MNEKTTQEKVQDMFNTKWWDKFSPTIMETIVPQKFIDIINNTGDEVLKDDGLSKKFDFSDNLVGKVHKEVTIPVPEDNKEYCLSILRQACVRYLRQMIFLGRAYEWKKKAGNKEPTEENIYLSQSWIVSQYKHEYNPVHTHSGNFSGVIYLKIPDGMEKHMQDEIKDHYPCSGLIEFSHGEKQDFKSDTLMFMPKVGQMLVFPNWLKHTVYPFYCEGERRSMSFNAYWKL